MLTNRTVGCGVVPIALAELLDEFLQGLKQTTKAIKVPPMMKMNRINIPIARPTAAPIDQASESF